MRSIFAAVKRSVANRLGNTVRRLRRDRELSQVVLAEKCGFYQTYLSRIERGKANPTLNALEVIANAFGMSIFELFQEVAQERSEKMRK
jgi:transcriptional regulator with XRE-family HTH domain